MTLSFLSRCSSEHAVGIRTWHVRCEPWSRVLRGTDELQGVPMLYGLSVGIHLVYVDGDDLMDDDPRPGTFLGDLAEEFPQRVRAVRNQRVVLDIRGAHEPVYVFRLLLVDYQIIEAKDIVLVANSAAIVGVYKLDHG